MCYRGGSEVTAGFLCRSQVLSGWFPGHCWFSLGFSSVIRGITAHLLTDFAAHMSPPCQMPFAVVLRRLRD